MRDLSEIRLLLDKLERHPAGALEGQDLDFKEWNTRSIRDAVALLVLREALLNAFVHAQQTESDARETLSRMELDLGYLERGGTGRGTYWNLRSDLHRRLCAPGHPERDRRIDWETAKTRVLSVLMERAKRGEPGLSNQEIRHITHLDRNQARRLMQELMKERSQIKKTGERRWTRYTYAM